MDDAHWEAYFAATTNPAERAAFANGQEYARQQLEAAETMNDLDLIELVFTRVRDFYRDSGYQGELAGVLDRIVQELRKAKHDGDDPHHGLGASGAKTPSTAGAGMTVKETVADGLAVTQDEKLKP